MLPKTHRIGSRMRVSTILRKGASGRSRFFYTKSLPNNSNHMRCSAVVSMRVAKKAVQRNALRRRLYEAVRLCIFENPSPCYDVVILATTKVASASFTDLVHDIKIFMKSL